MLTEKAKAKLLKCIKYARTTFLSAPNKSRPYYRLANILEDEKTVYNLPDTLLAFEAEVAENLKGESAYLWPELLITALPVNTELTSAWWLGLVAICPELLSFQSPEDLVAAEAKATEAVKALSAANDSTPGPRILQRACRAALNSNTDITETCSYIKLTVAAFFATKSTRQHKAVIKQLLSYFTDKPLPT